jgi:hypothetical protein
VQLAALGIAEVIVRRASPAGLMQKCAAEHRSGAARALASLAIARRASWLGPAWLGALNRYVHLRPMQENRNDAI